MYFLMVKAIGGSRSVSLWDLAHCPSGNRLKFCQQTGINAINREFLETEVFLLTRRAYTAG